MFDLVSSPSQELPFELWFFGPSANRPFSQLTSRDLAHLLFISSVKHGLICFNGGMPKMLEEYEEMNA